MFQQTNSGVTTLCDKVCQLFEAGRLFSPMVYCQSGPNGLLQFVNIGGLTIQNKTKHKFPYV
jgi:hypothetical protein